MKLYPITLGVKRTNWSAKKTGPIVSDVAKAAEAVFTRDDHTCRCCGFRAEKWQEVLHINGDTRDFSDKNVLTTCVFCHQCFDLESAARMGSGMLIWLPEMSQADLNNLMRAAYISRKVPGPMQSLATQIADLFYSRKDDAKRRLGSHDPDALAIVLRDFLTSGQYEKARQGLDGIRLFPLSTRMVENPDPDQGGTTNELNRILNYWHSKVYHEIPPQNWTKLFEKANDLVAS